VNGRGYETFWRRTVDRPREKDPAAVFGDSDNGQTGGSADEAIRERVERQGASRSVGYESGERVEGVRSQSAW
jgi:hypothetical protein